MGGIFVDFFIDFFVDFVGGDVRMGVAALCFEGRVYLGLLGLLAEMVLSVEPNG